jgi:hypothetical protein
VPHITGIFVGTLRAERLLRQDQTVSGDRHHKPKAIDGLKLKVTGLQAEDEL